MEISWTLVYLLFTLPLSTQDYVVPKSCHEGQYLTDEGCKSCPPRSFENKKIHNDRSCIPWTYKAGQNWVVDTPGTSISDQEWMCAQGYVLKPITVFENDCVEKPATPSHVTASSMTTDLAESTSSSSKTIGQSGIDKEENIAGLNVGLICVLVVTGLLLLSTLVFISWRHVRKKRNDGIIMDDARRKFFRDLISRLGDNASTFASVLWDPTGEINHYVKFKDYEDEVLVDLLVDWAKRNPNILHYDRITDALEFIYRPKVLNEMTVINPFKSLSEERGPKNSPEDNEIYCLHRLFWYVTNNLLDDDIQHFIMQLPDSSESIFTTVLSRNKKQYPLQIAYIQTVLEWYRRNDADLESVFNRCLKDIGACNILESSTYRDLIECRRKGKETVQQEIESETRKLAGHSLLEDIDTEKETTYKRDSLKKETTYSDTVQEHQYSISIPCITVPNYNKPLRVSVQYSPDYCTLLGRAEKHLV